VQIVLKRGEAVQLALQPADSKQDVLAGARPKGERFYVFNLHIFSDKLQMSQKKNSINDSHATCGSSGTRQ
jgi:hypothetical protein